MRRAIRLRRALASAGAATLLAVPIVAASAEGDTPPVEPLEAKATPPPPDYRTLYVAERERSERRLAGWRRAERKLVRLHVAIRRRWSPSVTYAIGLASAVFGVPRWQLRSVAWCESRYFPFATNGRYRGVFQLSWSPFGMSPFDPIANVLSAAQTVRQDGGWRQWECKP